METHGATNPQSLDSAYCIHTPPASILLPSPFHLLVETDVALNIELEASASQDASRRAEDHQQVEIRGLLSTPWDAAAWMWQGKAGIITEYHRNGHE